MKYLGALLIVAALPAADLNVSDRFYAAVRAGDAASLRQMLRSGVEVNARDARGATPLLYAAAVGTPETMRTLIDAGADVNAATAFGATALLWSTASLEKVRLLVERGANVNARSKMGNTPLLPAAAQPGNGAVLRYLLDHGANLAEARNSLGQTPLLRAAAANDLEMVRLLIDRGAPANTRDALGFTPLMFASSAGNIEMTRLLLARGADVNARLEPHINTVKNGPLGIGTLTPLMFAATSRNPEVVRLLLEAGADVNARDVRGMTPLMLAVATDHADPETVRLLLACQPDLRVKSALGETALAWAAKFQDPAVLESMRHASPGPEAPRVVPVSAARAGLRDPRPAAARSLALIQRNTTSFFREGGCVSCHAHHITGMAVAIARSRGVHVDESAAAEDLRATRLEFASRSDQFLERIDGPADVILTTALLALAVQDVPPDRMTDAMVRNIASQQMPAGYWSSLGIVRPPTADGHFSITAAAIRSLRQYGPPALKEEYDARVARALQWLLHAGTSTTEDAVMQLLGAKWAGADRATLAPLAAKLLALQRPNGGWAQTPRLSPDAYATGTALYALHEAGALAPSSAPYRRGVRFLLDTQAADGSWYVASRAPKFQPYFETGFPYSHDQWISQWATGWAAIALALAAPEPVTVGAVE